MLEKGKNANHDGKQAKPATKFAGILLTGPAAAPSKLTTRNNGILLTGPAAAPSKLMPNKNNGILLVGPVPAPSEPKTTAFC